MIYLDQARAGDWPHNHSDMDQRIARFALEHVIAEITTLLSVHCEACRQGYVRHLCEAPFEKERLAQLREEMAALKRR